MNPLTDAAHADGQQAVLTPVAQDLRAFNTLGLASHTHAFVEIDDAAQLPALAQLAREYPGLLVLGGGSNMVLPSQVNMLVAHMRLRGIRLLDTTADHLLIEAAAGERWHEVVAHTIAQGWPGLENLALIPGQTGAAPVQNIGAYGVELKDRFDSVVAYDLHEESWVEMDHAACAFAYRDSIFKHHPGRWIITAVRFRLPRAWAPVLDYPDLQRHSALAAAREAGNVTAQQIFDAVCEIRIRKLPDPAVLGNAGSFFKNPIVDAATHIKLAAEHTGLVAYPQADGNVKLAAGWLIDQCGWKGKALGRAGVHAAQALVLVNLGGSSAADIMALARAIQADVMTKFGVVLEPEPIVVT
ncbi:UDP-N-acetylmuramate dehydrogenase [Pigmentiphaga aceris]|uniref:UDP-N-acetylenolpyruvoylglucosamine reductase n=1 Tax=Pigmentiphaga aceris TaxID=1940612 RepID=A0A5C0B5H7_9BURK|nr:UDP-N-acetylmuramate dehydrogenase [Pigmentiphaga aceris]QEI09374.1 UDP-N-acetylmuramate dehydrogenase [Pigmentiphaga aceris]